MSLTRIILSVVLLVLILSSLFIVTGASAYYGLGTRQIGILHSTPCDPSLRDSAPCGPNISGGGPGSGK